MTSLMQCEVCHYAECGRETMNKEKEYIFHSSSFILYQCSTTACNFYTAHVCARALCRPNCLKEKYPRLRGVCCVPLSGKNLLPGNSTEYYLPVCQENFENFITVLKINLSTATVIHYQVGSQYENIW